MFRINQEMGKKGTQMTASSATTQNPPLAKSGGVGLNIDESAQSETAGKPEQAGKPQNIIAVLLNPGCKHDWSKLENELQTLESEGKTIWKCQTCSEITNTYDWQTPKP